MGAAIEVASQPNQREARTDWLGVPLPKMQCGVRGSATDDQPRAGGSALTRARGFTPPSWSNSAGGRSRSSRRRPGHSADRLWLPDDVGSTRERTSRQFTMCHPYKSKFENFGPEQNWRERVIGYDKEQANGDRP